MRIVYSFLGIALLALAGALTCAAQQNQNTSMPSDVVKGVSSGATRVVDLSYAIRAGLPAWPGDSRTFEATPLGDPARDGYFTRSFWMLEHYGTHMDAPAHFPPGKATVDQISPNNLIGPAVLIDVSSEAGKNPDYRLTTARIEAWERAHGKILRGSIVLLRTGWSSRWPDETRYRNEDAQGVMHTPGYSVEAAQMLIERGASGLGIDTLSIDYGLSKNFEVHRVALPAGLYQLENLANLAALPESGAWLVVAPIKLAGGSGGPCRVFALLPQ
jgi:kynurenine formamidase